MPTLNDLISTPFSLELAVEETGGEACPGHRRAEEHHQLSLLGGDAGKSGSNLHGAPQNVLGSGIVELGEDPEDPVAGRHAENQDGEQLQIDRPRTGSR